MSTCACMYTYPHAGRTFHTQNKVFKKEDLFYVYRCLPVGRYVHCVHGLELQTDVSICMGAKNLIQVLCMSRKCFHLLLWATFHYFNLVYVYMCVCLRGVVCTEVQVPWGQKRKSNPLEMELQMNGGHPTWVLQAECGSSGKAEPPLSPHLCTLNLSWLTTSQSNPSIFGELFSTKKQQNTRPILPGLFFFVAQTDPRLTAIPVSASQVNMNHQI